MTPPKGRVHKDALCILKEKESSFTHFSRETRRKREGGREIGIGDMSGRWSVTSLRWLDFSFPLRSSIFRWPQLLSSYFGATRRVVVGGGGGWGFLRWPELGLGFSILDDVVWSLVTAFESVALVSMLCFFFLFCGCTI